MNRENRHIAHWEPSREAVAIAAVRRPAELWLLGSLLAFYLLVYDLNATVFFHLMNLLGPVVMTAILGWSCYRIAMKSPIAIWAPLFWFRLACATYYGFGALVPHVVNEETRQQIFNLYYFDDLLNLKVNIIYCLGIFFTLFFSSLFLSKQKYIKEIKNYDRNSSRLLLFALFFLLIGGALRYILVVPYTFGLTQTILPGIFANLSRMYYVGIYLLITYGISHSKAVLPLALVLVGVDIAVSIASFAKAELLLILIFAFLGFISRDTSKTKIIIGTSCVLFAFFAFQPLVSYGRDQLYQRYNSILGAGIDERLEIVRNYLNGGRESVASTRQGGLSRLSYVNVDAFVVDKYDAGNPGSTLRNAAAVVIPRILWPDKPIITQLGADLNFRVFGFTGSSLGVGHFAEAYWNFGWAGVAPFMIVLASILSIYTKVSMRIIARQDWLLLPVVFIGVNMGLRVDGFFVPDILGPGWIAVCVGFGLQAGRSMLGKFLGGGAKRERDSAWGRKA